MMTLWLMLAMGPLSPPGTSAASRPAALVSPAELLPPLPTAVDSVARLRQEAGNRARRFETEHFLLVHTAAPHSVRKLGARLEAVYRAHVRFVRELRISPRRPPHKLEVLLFGTCDEFRVYQQRVGSSDEEVLGFYDADTNRSVFFDLATYPPVAQLCEQRPDLRDRDFSQRKRLSRKLRHNTQALNCQVIQHEAAHQIQFNIRLLPGAGVPTWLAEGLAQLFELPFSERGATLALSTNRYRLYEFDELHGCRGDTLAQLRRIIADEAAWCGSLDYSVAWALTSYLYIRKRVRFGEYVRSVAARASEPPPGSEGRLREFERCFGPLDQGFVNRFCAYVQRLHERCPRGPLASP